MNWAEQTYPQLLAPSPSASATYAAYHYQYYPGTQTYVGTQNGSAYTTGADGVIREQGVLGNFTSVVHGAGF